MKKFTTIVMMAFMAIFLTSFSLKAEEGTADLTIHYQNWSGEYEGLGAHLWGPGLGAVDSFHGQDDFGVYLEFTDLDVSVEVGFIAVEFVDGAQNWDKKETGDVKIPGGTLKPGEHHHVYIFQGADSVANAPGYYLAKNDTYNMLLVYVDPSGTYEENLGVHAWSGWTHEDNGWGSPAQVFTNGASHTAVATIKVAMLHSTSPDAGLLIYAGSDDDKKTGDVKLLDALATALGEDVVPKVGDTGFAYVYSKGSAYTVNDNVLYDAEEFIENAFTFRLLPMGRDAQGQFTGTYAPAPDQVIVSLSALVANPRTGLTEDEDLEAANELVKTWFTVTELDGESLAIDEVHFDQNAETIKDFVVILSENFDITKDYVVSFDLGLEGDENRAGEIEIDLDRNKPVITFASPSEVVGKPAAERIIHIEWNKKFPANRFPSFIVTDDRDGDISHLVYVPAGEFSTINTNVEGDYTIMLRVEDRWGNITEETFIFRVTRDMP
ncbi:MAG TPA: hypothetical protein GX742_03965 [Acholeplasmataceae bacterium]|nr:hypothetical protein [Acholeplasmataceae bacterium]